MLWQFLKEHLQIFKNNYLYRGLNLQRTIKAESISVLPFFCIKITAQKASQPERVKRGVTANFWSLIKSGVTTLGPASGYFVDKLTARFALTWSSKNGHFC